MTSNVEDIGANDVGHVGQNRGQPFGVVGLVDVGNVGGALLGRVGVADIIDVEAQRFGEVVEAMYTSYRHKLTFLECLKVQCE